MNEKMIILVLSVLFLSGCDKPRDHKAAYEWAKEFCGKEGIRSFNIYDAPSFPDRVYCMDGRNSDVPVE